MKGVKIILLIIYLLVLGVFLVINQMTPIPGASSGNGNPALLLAWVLLPLLYFLVLLWIRILRMYSINTFFSLGGLLVIMIHQITAFSYQKREINEYRQVIKNALFKRYGIVDEEYVRTITKGMSIHVNNQYFNLNTYFMFVTFSIFVAMVCILWIKKKEKKYDEY
ncbi:hypothetical protein [Cytobacillus praedii]|uniref:hypothetical protein n=1 Tax=Cytobacillus praedii TaxID=1742358 RepID=UPI002E227845|nr:hypothetical protein [Cytobacillus praedii]